MPRGRAADKRGDVANTHPALQKDRKAVIFDFDYTLADSSTGIIESTNYALRTMGLPARSPETIKALIGFSLAGMFEALASEPRDERTGEFQRLFIERADQVMLGHMRLFETVAPVVGALASRGISMGIVSIKFRSRIEAVLSRDGLAHVFDVIVGGEDVARHKPDPMGLVVAVERLNTKPEEALYVGDSVVDAEAAGRAGIPFVAVLSGVTPREAFAPHRPVAVMDDLSLLPELLP